MALEPLLHMAGRSSCSSYLGYWLKSFWLPWQPDPYRGKHIVTCCNPHRQTDRLTDRQTDRQKASSAARRDSTGEATWIAWQAKWLLSSNPIRRLAHFLTFAIFVHFLHSVQKLKEFKESDICPSVCFRFNTSHKFEPNTTNEVQAENRQNPPF